MSKDRVILICFRTGDKKDVWVHQKWYWPDGVSIKETMAQVTKVTTKDPKGFYLRKYHRPVTAHLLTTMRKIWEVNDEQRHEV